MSRTKLAGAVIVAAVVLSATYMLSQRHDEAPSKHVSAVPAGANPPSIVGAADTARSLATVSMNVGEHGPPSPTELDARFAQATDYVAFIQSVLASAQAGNARAQFLIGQAVQFCRGESLLYKNEADPRAAFEKSLSTWKGRAADNELLKEASRRDFLRCERMIREDPFAALPSRDSPGYAASYWEDEAIRNGDPLAKAARAAKLLGGLDLENGQNARDAISAARTLLASAIVSGDPGALARASLTMADRRLAPDARLSVALMLVACQRGMDCSVTNRMFFGDCLATGKCSAGEQYADIVLRGLGAEAFASADATAQRIRAAIQNGDQSAIEQLLAVQG
jgi:hypothetical protein